MPCRRDEGSNARFGLDSGRFGDIQRMPPLPVVFSECPRICITRESCSNRTSASTHFRQSGKSRLVASVHASSSGQARSRIQAGKVSLVTRKLLRLLERYGFPKRRFRRIRLSSPAFSQGTQTLSLIDYAPTKFPLLLLQRARRELQPPEVVVSGEAGRWARSRPTRWSETSLG
jgi:hypothetical protein